MPLAEEGRLFYKEMSLTEPECDSHNRLRLSDSLRRMQEISGEHLTALDLPYDKLYASGQVFLLSKIWVDMIRCPHAGEVLRWQTRPLPPIGVHFIRCNDVLDTHGKLVLHAESLWILVDPESRRVLRPSSLRSPLPFNGVYEKRRLERFRVPVPLDSESVAFREVLYSDLDVNRHMNNAIYADVVSDYLPDQVLEENDPSALFLHFQNEARLHDALEIRRAQISEDCWHIAADKKSAPCFGALLKTKRR